MPTRAEMPSRLNHSGLHLRGLEIQEVSRSWTDDLPVCRVSGVGLSTNQIYREDGQRREEHECEDRSFHFRVDEDTFFYGVFDGHEGSRAAHFAAQRMPAEVLLGQLTGKISDKEVKDVLMQAFVAVERGFFESIDDLLAEKANLQCELPEGLNSYEAYKKCPEVFSKLQQITSEISGGTTAVVALIKNNRLYVANIGDSRALLFRTDKDHVSHVKQLSVSHDLNNQDELLRLSDLGLNIEKLRMSRQIGSQSNTRCLGNYMLKEEFRDFENLRDARERPVVGEPEVLGGITIDESLNFLLLMSNGLCKALEEATGNDQVNEEIVKMVTEQFMVQSTLNGVAQAVVDKVVRIHHDIYTTSCAATCHKRDDITLLVRNFNHPMPNALSSPTGVRVYPVPGYQPLLKQSFISEEPPRSTGTDIADSTAETGTTSSVPKSTQATTNSSSDSERQLFPQRQNNVLPLDEDGRIEPYVDFSDFYQAVQEAQEQGIATNIEL